MGVNVMSRFLSIHRWLVALALAAGAATSAAAPPAEFRRAAAGHWVAEYEVPGADGTRLQTLVYLPPSGTGPFPTLVTRSPYDLPLTPVSGFPEDHANAGIEADPKDIGWTEATDRGYALVIQFIRGRNESDGTFSLFLDERADGAALIRWIESQGWSNGRIGVFGDSASGVVSLQAAAAGRPSVRAVYAQATSADFLGGVIFPDRHVKWEALLPFALAQSLSNSEDHVARLGLPAETVEALAAEAGEALGGMFEALEAGDATQSSWWTQAPRGDLPVVSELQPRWADLIAARERPAVLAANDVGPLLRAPVLQVSLWHDFFHDSAMRAWSGGRAGGRDDRLIVLDGTHYDVDDPELWPFQPMFTWFDHWLKGEADEVRRWPRVQFTWAGEGAESIVGSDRWPLNTRSMEVSIGSAAGVVVDPARPVPTLGGNHLIAPPGMLDQAPLLQRPDVGLLRGTPLTRPLRIAGEVEASIRLRARAPGPVVVKLVDVRADGEVRLLREKVVDGRSRNRLDLRFSPLAYRFEAGSTPSILVAGSSFPAFVLDGGDRAGWIDAAGGRLTLPDASTCRCGDGAAAPRFACRLVPAAAEGAVCRVDS
jgi:putative CocE/NonD family hydrolase